MLASPWTGSRQSASVHVCMPGCGPNEPRSGRLPRGQASARSGCGSNRYFASSTVTRMTTIFRTRICQDCDAGHSRSLHVVALWPGLSQSLHRWSRVRLTCRWRSTSPVLHARQVSLPGSSRSPPQIVHRPSAAHRSLLARLPGSSLALQAEHSLPPSAREAPHLGQTPISFRARATRRQYLRFLARQRGQRLYPSSGLAFEQS